MSGRMMIRQKTSDEQEKLKWFDKRKWRDCQVELQMLLKWTPMIGLEETDQISTVFWERGT